jgi:hypothetical protein
MRQVIPGSDAILIDTDGTIVTKKLTVNGVEITGLGGGTPIYGSVNMAIGTDQPVNPVEGDLWIDTN